MKQIWNYMFVALAGLSMLSCNKEITEPSKEDNTPSEYTYLITIDEGTRSYLDGDHMAWEEGDGVGWCAFSGSYGNKWSGYSAINMTNPRTFSVTSPISIDYGGHIYACAPCGGINDDGEANLVIPTEQDGVIKGAMPMVSLPIDVTTTIPNNTTTPVGQASFLNLGAVIQYNIYTSTGDYETEEIQSVTFTATTPVAGDFTVNLTSVAEDAIPSPNGLTEKSVTSFLDAPAVAGISKEYGLKVYQVVAPGTLSGTVTVTTDAATYSYSVSNIVFDRATIKTLNVNLASTNATRRTLVDYETLLTAHEWHLVSVADSDGTDITQNAGDLLQLNADYSLSVTCNTHTDEVYDYMNGEWVYYGLGYEWDYWTREWSLSAFYGAWPILDFTGYAYPLAIVTDNTDSQSYYIVSLTDSELVLQYGVPCLYTITFSDGSAPAPAPATPEEMLTAHEWELTSVLRMYPGDPLYETEYSDVTQTAGNKMTLNADHSFTFDCIANSGLVYDYWNRQQCVHPDLREWDYYGQGFWEGATLEWSVSESGGTNNLVFSKFAYPLLVIDDVTEGALSYEIAVLTDSCLELHYSETYFDYIITFTTPGEKSRVECLLTAHDWELSTVTRDGVDVTETAGNLMTLNADYSFSFNCSANNGYTAYYPGYPNCVTDPTDDLGYSWATYEWSVSFGAVTSLVFTQYSYPLVVVDSEYRNKALSYKIAELTDSSLVLEYIHSTDGTYTITYTATATP